MSNYKKLTTDEKDAVFENIWENYSKKNVNTSVYIYLGIAAMIFLSVIMFAVSNKSKIQPNNVISSIIEDDIYEDNEIIFDDSINEMSNKELDNILAQL